MTKKPITDDPFSNLPRRSLFGRDDGGAKSALLPVPKSIPVANENERADYPVTPKAVLSKAEKAAAPLAVPKGRGRPKTEGVRPWEAEGISKALYYRRRQKKGTPK